MELLLRLFLEAGAVVSTDALKQFVCVCVWFGYFILCRPHHSVEEAPNMSEEIRTYPLH